MHPAALDWVGRWSTLEPVSVLDIGGRNINGDCRGLFPNAHYTSLDLYAGDGVDIVADACSWTPDRQYDLVLAVEVFEHCAQWPDICLTAAKACSSLFICTMAGPGRPEHSGIDGEWRLLDGEHYENIEPATLEAVLAEVGFVNITVDQSGLDVRAVAETDR